MERRGAVKLNFWASVLITVLVLALTFFLVACGIALIGTVL